MGHRQRGAPVIGGGGLPPIDPSTFPRAVREGTDDDRKAYRAALGFERVMLGELLKQVDVLGGEEGQTDGAPAAYRDLLPQTLADALVQNGGVGMAGSLYEAIGEQSR